MINQIKLHLNQIKNKNTIETMLTFSYASDAFAIKMYIKFKKLCIFIYLKLNFHLNIYLKKV